MAIVIPNLDPKFFGCAVSGQTALVALDKVIVPGDTVLITAAAGI